MISASVPTRILGAIAVAALAATALVAASTAAVAGGPPPDLAWAGQFDGPNGDALTVALAADPAGNSYSTGNFSGTVDFDPGPGTANLTAAGNLDVYVVKLDPRGELVWARQLGGPGAAVFATGVALDGAGNPHLTGYFFDGEVDFDPGPGERKEAAAGFADSYVVVLDDAGNLQRAGRFGGANADVRIAGVAVDGSGNTHVTGAFFGEVDFDPGAGTTALTASLLDGFVAVLDPAGALVRAGQMGGPNAFTEPDGVAVDHAGNSYVTGALTGEADLDPGVGQRMLSQAGAESDAFLLKLDQVGGLAWAGLLGGADGGAHGREVAVHRGYVYVGGTFTGKADLDPSGREATVQAAGTRDAYVTRTDRDGNVSWVATFGGPGAEVFLEDVNVDGAAGAHIIGQFTGTADFEPGTGAMNLTAAGTKDGYVAKLDTTGALAWAGSIGGADADVTGFNLALDETGNTYFAGLFTRSIDADPGPGEHRLTADGVAAFAGRLGQLPPAPPPPLPFPATVAAIDQDQARWYLVDPIVAGLSGGAEVPAGSGDPFGEGRAVVTVNERAGKVCFDLDLFNLQGTVTAAHIHQGRAGGNGPVVVDFDWAANGPDGCVAVAKAVIDQILADLAGHYVNVHTDTHPAGAVRGQLGGGPRPPILYGNPGDVPFLGDWDGDGVDTPGMYRPSDGKVYLRNSNSTGVADIEFFFGDPLDVPIVGDWDGDGDDTIGVYRPSQGRFFIHDQLGAGNRGLGPAQVEFFFGDPFDVPFPGDFDGDGKDTVGVKRGNVFYWRNALSSGPPANPSGLRFGDPADKPMFSDWDGDGLETPGVHRTPEGTFYLPNTRRSPGIADMEIFTDGFESGDTSAWSR